MTEISIEMFKRDQTKYWLLDVREPEEREVSSIEPAIAIPLGQLELRYTELPLDRPIVVICRSGARSSKATSFLQSKGINALNLTGGIIAYGISNT
ncbi:MAG: rhodanese-like domain-containing protein [Simkaniaceae bacterium]|nr:rhodanese-like domain-containing protein [Simkaniaceae bacterium]